MGGGMDMSLKTEKFGKIMEELDKRSSDCFKMPVLIFSDDRAKERFRLGVLKSGKMLFNAKYSSLEKFIGDLFVPTCRAGDESARSFRIVNKDYLHYTVFKLLSDSSYVTCSAIRDYFCPKGQLDSVKLLREQRGALLSFLTRRFSGLRRTG